MFGVVFLPVGSVGGVGQDGEQVDTAPCIAGGWVGATHTGESGLSHVYSSHCKRKVVVLTAEDAF